MAIRLLRYDESQIISFSKAFANDEIPPYAILSHTWQEGEEVTYDEMISGRNKEKAGYDKIRCCGQQAKRDGLEYFWVDTCCINKADQVELRDAISSMFSWYQNSAKCYVFLSDISIGKRKADNELFEYPWAAAFKTSKWFTRGWTLQELLAPRAVEFFSREWKKLGDKVSLRRYICEATRIPDTALQDALLSQFSVNERLKWGEHRKTRLAEDRAYCLMGILGVYITPFEDEGAGGAFRRLMDEVDKLNKCLQDIRVTDPRDDKKRIEDTKDGLLEESYRWIFDNASFQQWNSNPENRLLWIKGDPGKGKTMLLCGTINELQKSMAKTGVAYFFCQATDSRINSAVAVLRGLLYLLINQQPSLAPHVRKKYDHAGKSLFEDVNSWVALTEIFADILRDQSLNTAYLIVDALDECVTDLPKLLEFIAKESSESSRIKWIVSSRNWPSIEEQLGRVGHERLSLELNAESVSAAVGIFIQQKVHQLAQERNYDDCTRSTVLEYLMLNANDTFLWVALVCKELRTKAKRNIVKSLNMFPPGLDALYERMVLQISKSDDAKLCKQVLATIALVYRPVTLDELVALVGQLEDTNDDAELREIIELCGSFLTVRKETIYFIHQSAKDFLLAIEGRLFPSGREDIHRTILFGSLRILSKTLHRDMYGLKALGYSAEDVKQPNPDPLAASRYSCIYWIDHLCELDFINSRFKDFFQDDGAVHVFLKEKYIYWLEGLSLCKAVPKGIVSIDKLGSLVSGKEDATVINKLIDDVRRFIMRHKVAIENSPLQVYASALLFSPPTSLVRETFRHEEPRWITIKPTMSDWGACLQTIEGHNSHVTSVVFSKNSILVASGSLDDTVKIWFVDSGSCFRTLVGHSDYVNSVAFSHDSTLLASASRDTTIKIWAVKSGECRQTLQGHSDEILSVAFSHDSTQLASAARDNTAKIWDVVTGECKKTLLGHSEHVASVVFSYNSATLASASWDTTIKIWDVASGACLSTMSHESHVWSVSFSHDSVWLASAYLGGIIKIWNTNSQVCVRRIDCCSNVTSVDFSHDSKWLAAGLRNHTVVIWDTHSGVTLQTLYGHGFEVNSVVFSHDSTRLASCSTDRTIKVWNMEIKDEQKLVGHTHYVNSVAFSYDMALLASASADGTAKIWNVASLECMHTFQSHIIVKEVAFSRDSSLLALGLGNGNIVVWDVRSEARFHTLETHQGECIGVAFSYDARQLASGFIDGKIKIWDTNSGACLQTFEDLDCILDEPFDPTSSHLYTNIGFIPIDRPTASSVVTIAKDQSSLLPSRKVSLDGMWIACDGVKTLWIPSEWRASCSAIAGRTIAIGSGSGRVWTCTLASTN